MTRCSSVPGRQEIAAYAWSRERWLTCWGCHYPGPAKRKRGDLLWHATDQVPDLGMSARSNIDYDFNANIDDDMHSDDVLL